MGPLKIVMTLPGSIHERLQEIEDQEGVKSVDLIVQAVGIFAALTADERMSLGRFALQLVADRARSLDI